MNAYQTHAKTEVYAGILSINTCAIVQMVQLALTVSQTLMSVYRILATMVEHAQMHCLATHVTV
jgi:hypothetical protein